MGTSSNWSFGRRVLIMTHEALTGTALPTDGLLFDGHVYDLKWDGTRKLSAQEGFGPSTLPTQDFAIYLINSVKFRCCQLYYLFNEEDFMQQFALYHENPTEYPSISPLWYVHYLIILAFGKAFVVQTSKSQIPPGAELFVYAMKLMPDLTFFKCDPIEKIHVLCCAALFLQCLNYRPAAHRYVSSCFRAAQM